MPKFAACLFESVIK